MTEAEWLACEDVATLLGWLESRTHSGRKWRLFSLACIEPIQARLRDARLTNALAVVALDVEGKAPPADAQRARHDAAAALDWIWEDANEQRWFYVTEYAARSVLLCTQPDYEKAAPQVAALCAEVLRLCADSGREESARRQAHRRQVALVHEVFGNPFRPVALDPAWLTSDVRLLARGIYDEKAFERMPILADALQDAGCDSEEVLGHCRDAKQVHVRGCWVVDLVLGKQ
jgi:hypothetical protein